MPSVSFSSLGMPMRRPLRSSRVGQRDRLGQLDRGRVAGIAAGDDLVEPGVVADGLRHRADLVEARREGDDPVPADRAVGGPQADDPAERGGLLDRAAGVGAERPRRQPAGDRGRGAAGRAAGDALGIPRVLRRPEAGVLRGGAHRELVQVRLAEERQAGVLHALGHGRVEHRDVALEDPRGGRRRDALRRDDVLERDRHAVAGRPRPR